VIGFYGDMVIGYRSNMKIFDCFQVDYKMISNKSLPELAIIALIDTLERILEL